MRSRQLNDWRRQRQSQVSLFTLLGLELLKIPPAFRTHFTILQKKDPRLTYYCSSQTGVSRKKFPFI